MIERNYSLGNQGKSPKLFDNIHFVKILLHPNGEGFVPRRHPVAIQKEGIDSGIDNPFLRTVKPAHSYEPERAPMSHWLFTKNPSPYSNI